MERYKLLGRAGEGAHGFVYKGLDVNTNKLVALKKIALNLSDSGLPKAVIREMCSLRALDCPNVVKLFKVASMGSSLVLIMEYLPLSLGDVIRHIECNLNLSQIKLYLKMLLTGVEYIHANHIMHRDLKPANLLINQQGILKLADFGLARIYSENGRLYSHQVATRWYRAPELLYGSRTYSSSIDMWSVGCILAEMLNKEPLFPGETDIEQLAIVLGTLGTPTEKTWPGLTQLPDYNKIAFSNSVPLMWTQVLPGCDSSTLDLIGKILIYDGSKRITAKEALLHDIFFTKPFIADLNDMPDLSCIKNEEFIKDFYGFDERII